MKKLHVKTGDTVVIMSGRERGKQGKVLAVSPEEGKVIIEGRNMVTKHVKPRRMGEQGGIVKAEGAMYACKVQVLCPHCACSTTCTSKRSKASRSAFLSASARSASKRFEEG